MTMLGQDGRLPVFYFEPPQCKRCGSWSLRCNRSDRRRRMRWYVCRECAFRFVLKVRKDPPVRTDDSDDVRK